jgi:hypothetical protein
MEEIMENKKTNTSNSNLVLAIVSFFIFICIFFANVLLPTECQINNIIINYCLPLLLQAVIFYLMTDFIEIIINENSKTQWIKAIIINLLIGSSSIMCVYNYEYLKNTIFQIISLITLFGILLYINYKVKIKEESNLPLFKAINYFMIVFWTALIFFLEECSNDTIKSFITLYCLLPLLMIQGFYELLDGKSKRKKVSQG